MDKAERRFAGLLAYRDEKVDIEKEFKQIYEDEYELFLLGKLEFQHREEGLNFNYKYAIKVLDIEALSGELGAPLVIELLLVPSPDSLAKKSFLGLASTYDDWYDDLEEDYKYLDIANYSFAVTMEQESLDKPKDADEKPFLEIPEVKDKIENAILFYKTIDTLRGFNLDRPWNRLGTTGWDTIKSAVNGEELFKFG